MAELIPKNAATGTIADNPLADDATVINLGTGQGSLFNDGGGVDQARARIELAADPTTFELIAILNRAGDVLTEVERGIEGTAALEWAAGSKVAEVVTEGGLTELLAQAGGGGGGVLLPFSYTLTGTINDGAETAYQLDISLPDATAWADGGDIGTLAFRAPFKQHASVGPQWETASYGDALGFYGDSPVVTCDLFTAKTVVEARLYGFTNNAASYNNPSAIKLEYSDNGSDWTTHEDRISMGTFGDDNPWMAIFDTSAQTPHRYWRFTATRNGRVMLSQVEFWGGGVATELLRFSGAKVYADDYTSITANDGRTTCDFAAVAQVDYDTDGYFAPGGDTTVFSIPETAKYHVEIEWNLDPDGATDLRSVQAQISYTIPSEMDDTITGQVRFPEHVVKDPSTLDTFKFICSADVLLEDGAEVTATFQAQSDSDTTIVFAKPTMSIHRIAR